GNAERPARHRQVGGAVRQSDVEPAPAAVADHRRHPGGGSLRLADPGTSAVAADHRVLDPVQLEQLERLREPAGGDGNLPPEPTPAARSPRAIASRRSLRTTYRW